ncbi:MAG: helix-turn-helix transcriptional regulator [Eubacterium sp.]|nr:helix-turn-helix transcriptional regulator [Eubacterium sp.]
MTQVGKNIKTNRTELQMTQQDLADKMSVTRQTISGWEQGVSQTKRY